MRLLRPVALLAVVAALTTPPFTDAAPRNLLQNPGFESGRTDHPWLAAAWDTSASELPTVFFGRDTMLARTGRWSVSVANLSTRIPVAHNWSQTVLVGREAWGKDLVFSVWTRSNGLRGRAYVLAQAYRDTASKMAVTWKVTRDEALRRLGINKIDDPLIDFGWGRQFFVDEMTDWVRREVRVFVAPSTNVIFLRAGMFGTGQVLFDDASLTLEPARPAPPLAPGTNLLADPGFEGDGTAWEYALLPYDGHRVYPDTTFARSGRASIRFEGGESGVVQARAGVCQPIANRNLAGKRIRLSGWVHTDSLKGVAYIKLYAHTIRGMRQDAIPRQFSMNTDWTFTTLEMDLPKDTYEVWAWFLYNGPAPGIVRYDDCVLEVLGPATGEPSRSTPEM
jgi:hypothetical protein